MVSLLFTWQRIGALSSGIIKKQSFAQCGKQEPDILILNQNFQNVIFSGALLLCRVPERRLGSTWRLLSCRSREDQEEDGG